MAQMWNISSRSKIFLTGCAGFIGYHVAEALLREGHEICGVDNLNDYYSPQLKQDRLALLKKKPGFEFHSLSVGDEATENLILKFKPDYVIHLAAQAGVRYSLQNPWAYIESNIIGFQRVIEALRKHPVRHFIYASSSSVYGKNVKVPYSTSDRTDEPVSLYAATKKSNELIASSYAALYKIPTTGLRFFTVYGSWGRPDMAYFNFTKKILNGETLPIFNHGDLRRDFTHISDIVESLLRCLGRPPEDLGSARLMNIGASSPVQLLDFVKELETVIGKPAKLELLPMQAGDVYQTYADVAELEILTGYKPEVNLAAGLREFYEWFQKNDAARKY